MKPIDNIPNKKTVITNINLGSSDKTFIPIEPFSPANENHKLAKINIKKDVKFDIPTIIRESMENNYDVLTNTENESDYSFSCKLKDGNLLLNDAFNIPLTNMI